jgi:filamentous hemagglutinin family protein
MKAPTVLLPLIFLSIALVGERHAQAQTDQPSNRIPIVDNTLGTQIAGSNNNFAITGGINRGQNLFHSFQDFSVPAGGAATFINPVGNQSIITRVTGNLFSDINGSINTQGANFFLINPNGIVFGSNAQLNVGRVFAASTANSIDLVDGAGKTINFGTNASGDAPLLAIDPKVFFKVSQFNMAGGNGEIRNFGTLQTGNQNQYIGLIGGNISIDSGQINAPGGRIELGGLSSPGAVDMASAGNNPRLNFPPGVNRSPSLPAQLSNVSITNGARINVAGANNGDIAINAHNIEVLGDSVLRAGIEAGLGTPQSIAGDINIKATGTIVIDSNGAVANNVRINSQGQSGNITVQANSLVLHNGANIQAFTLGRGNTGDIRVLIAGDINIMDTNSGINTFVGENAVGNGGNITVTTSSISLQNGATLAAVTSGQGNAGNITVNAKNAILLVAADIASTLEGLGNGGNIDINAESLSLRNGATLTAATFGQGNAGNIKAQVTGSVDIVGSGIITSVNQGAAGMGGSIVIDAGSLSLLDGGQLRALTLGQGNAGNVMVTARNVVSLTGARTAIIDSVEADSVGKGGNIDIQADSLFLTNGSFLTSSNNGTGDAGNINVKATGAVNIVGISSNRLVGGIASLIGNNAVGNGGNITIDARSFLLQDSASLLAGNLGKGNAGAIKITAVDAVLLSGSGGLFVTTASNQGTGGEIVILSPQVTLDNGSRINADSISGNGGNIRIGSPATDLLLLRRGAQLATNASGTPQQGGDGGNINIDSRLVVALPTENSDITANAVKGRGGNVNINSQGLFGLQLHPQQTSNSDITASSVFGQSGNININTPGIDPGKNNGQLPIAPTDASKQISPACSRQRRINKFYITGRGGHPPNTDNPLTNDVVWLDPRANQAPTSSAPATPKFSPAVGWLFNGQGKVTLIAASPTGETTKVPTICPTLATH